MTTRNEYLAQMKAKLDEWNAEIDELEAKARKTQAQAVQGYYERLSRLRAKRDEATQRFAELRGSGDDAWEGLKSAAETLWSELKMTLDDTKDAFLEGAGKGN